MYQDRSKLPDLKNPLPMPAVKTPKTETVAMTNEIEATKRLLFHCLDRIRRAGKHRVLTAEFEERLEEHLEALRKDASASQARIGELYSEVQQWKDIAEVRQESVERDQNDLMKMRQANTEIQERLHAVDRAFFEQSRLLMAQAQEIDRLKVAAQVAGECIQDTQTVNRSYQIEIKSLNQQLQARDETIGKLRAEGRQHLDDCRSAEKHSDDFSEKLLDAQAVIGHQEQLIVGQRLAIAELHMVVRSAKSAVATLKRLGYTDCGGQLWKPPIGKKPEFTDGHCETCDGLGYVHCNGGRPAVPCPKGCQ